MEIKITNDCYVGEDPETRKLVSRGDVVDVSEEEFGRLKKKDCAIVWVPKMPEDLEEKKSTKKVAKPVAKPVASPEPTSPEKVSSEQETTKEKLREPEKKGAS